MESAGHKTARESGVFFSLDGFFVGWQRAAIQRHTPAGPHGHGGKRIIFYIVVLRVTICLAGWASKEESGGELQSGTTENHTSEVGTMTGGSLPSFAPAERTTLFETSRRRSLLVILGSTLQFYEPSLQ